MNVFSNINDSVDILGCYTVNTAVIDVYHAVGLTHN